MAHAFYLEHIQTAGRFDGRKAQMVRPGSQSAPRQMRHRLLVRPRAALAHSPSNAVSSARHKACGHRAQKKLAPARPVTFAPLTSSGRMAAFPLGFALSHYFTIGPGHSQSPPDDRNNPMSCRAFMLLDRRGYGVAGERYPVYR